MQAEVVDGHITACVRRSRVSAPPAVGAIGPSRHAPLEQTARKLGPPSPYRWAEVWMAGAYSTDLRSRVLAAVEAGESPEMVAERFVVGRSTVYRWVAAARDEGRR